MSIIGVVVLAELIVVLTGGIDISVGSALGLAAVDRRPVCSAVRRCSSALLVAVVIGGAVGAVNGWLVAFRGLEPFIVTLGMLALARGLVYAYGNGIPITPAAAPAFAEFGQSTFLGIPVLAIIWLAMVGADRVPAVPHRVGSPRLRHRLQHRSRPRLRHPGQDHPVVGLHPGRAARRPGWLDVPGPVRLRHLHRRQPDGAGSHRRRRDRRCGPVRWQGQGVRRRRWAPSSSP